MTLERHTLSCTSNICPWEEDDSFQNFEEAEFDAKLTSCPYCNEDIKALRGSMEDRYKDIAVVIWAMYAEDHPEEHFTVEKLPEPSSVCWELARVTQELRKGNMQGVFVLYRTAISSGTKEVLKSCVARNDLVKEKLQSVFN